MILAGDLAGIYGVDAKRLNEQVRRGSDRFPADFVFRLVQEEFELLRTRGTIGAGGRVALRSQNATLKRGQHVKYDAALRDIYRKLLPLLQPPPDPPKRRIGFQTGGELGKFTRLCMRFHRKGAPAMT